MGEYVFFMIISSIHSFKVTIAAYMICIFKEGLILRIGKNILKTSIIPLLGILYKSVEMPIMWNSSYVSPFCAGLSIVQMQLSKMVSGIILLWNVAMLAGLLSCTYLH